MKKSPYIALFYFLFILPVLSQEIEKFSNEASIKVFITEVVYERMEYWESSNNNPLSNVELEGIKTFQLEFLGRSNWEQDSISALLLRTNWDSCNTQVFLPLVMALEQQQDQGRYDFQEILDTKLGAKFETSSNFSSLVEKYSDHKASEKGTSIEPSKSAENSSQTSGSSDGISQGYRNRIGNSSFTKAVLLLILIVLVVILIFLAVSWVNRKKLQAKYKQTGSSSSEEGSKWRIMELEGKIAKLNEMYSKKDEETKNLKERIQELEAQIHGQSESKHEIEEILMNPVAEAQTNFEYYDNHEKGVFLRSTARKHDGPRTVFKIEVDNSKGRLHILTGKMDSLLIADKDIFLESTCKISIIPGGNRDKIVNTRPGIVSLQDDKWAISSKAEVQIR